MGEAALSALVQELLEAAVGRLCPAQAHLGLRRAVPIRKRQNSDELESRLPLCLWRAMPVTGAWHSVGSLGHALLADILSAGGKQLCILLHSSAATCDGRLLFLLSSPATVSALRCPLCCALFPGKRALRNHVQSAAHSMTAVDSVALVRSASERAGAKPESMSVELSPACAAARAGDEDALRMLCDDRQLDRHGCGALHWAAGCGHVVSTQYLLSIGHSPTAGCSKGRTPLHWAARNGHVPLVHILVAAGASPAIESLDGTTPLHLAAWQGQLSVCIWLAAQPTVDVFQSNAFGCNAGHWAAMAPSASAALPVMQWLDAQGWDWSVPNAAGHNALHKAASHGCHKTVAWLLQTSRPPYTEAADAEGHTAMDLAALWGRAETVQALLAAGAIAGGRATTLASAMGHADVVALLTKSTRRDRV